MTELITETHPPALSRVSLHLLPEDIYLLVSLVKLHLSFLLRYLVFTRGPLQQNFVLLDSFNTLRQRDNLNFFTQRKSTSNL